MRTFQRTFLAGAVALALSAPAAAQFTECDLLRGQLVPTRDLQPVVPPGTGCSRRIPGRSGRGPSARTYGFSDLAREPGRHRLRVWRRARGAAVRAFRRPRRSRAPSRSRRRSPNSSRRVRPIRLPSTRSYGGANDIFTQVPRCSTGRSRRPTRRPTSALAATQTRGADRACCTPQARDTSSCGTCPTSARRRTASAVPPGRRSLPRLASSINTTLIAAAQRARRADASAVNAFALLNEVLANPGLFGFTNATLPACTARRRILCTPANAGRAECGDKTYLFADGVHPTTACPRDHRAGRSRR